MSAVTRSADPAPPHRVDARPDRAERLELAPDMGRKAATLAGEALSDEVTAKAKLCLLDFLSCALAAHELPWSRQAVEIARGSSVLRGPGESRGAGILGTRHLVAAHDAAFANAVLGHGLVRDDMHLGSVSHLGVVVLPPLLALAEGHRPTGRDFLAAVVAGYQAGGELGRAIMDVEVARTFRPTGTVGPVAGAAGAARLLRFDPRLATNAIAIAANTAAGYNEWAATGGSEMFFHVGFAARNAVTAAQLAAAGADASASALDGPAGMLAAFRKAPPQSAGASGPRRLEILDVFFKPVPACNFAQSAAQAALELAASHAIDTATISSIRIRVPFAAAAYPGCDCPGPFQHILQAKMSIQYTVAAALVTRGFLEQSYRPQEQPEIVRLAALAAVEVDEELTGAFPHRQGAEIIVEAAGVETRRCRFDDIVPASAGEVRNRFATAAAAALGRARADRLAELIDNVETLDNAGELAAAACIEP